MKVKVEIEVKDKNGNVKEKRIFQSRSWVKNWIYMLNACFKAGETTVKDVNGDDVTYKGVGEVFNVDAGSGDDSKGILVGLSDTAWNKDQYCLQDKITHGSGSNQLLYGEQTISDAVDDPVEPYFRISRTFTNESGASITIKELGVVVKNSYNSTEILILILRDVLSSPVTVSDGYAVTVRYTFFIYY